MIGRLLRKSERGTSTVELALIVPTFLLMLVGVFDVSWMVILSNMSSEAAREGARAGIVLTSPTEAATPVAVPGSVATPIAAAARNQVATFNSSTYDVTSTTGGSPESGYYLQVVVSTTYQPVASAFLPIGSKNVGATSRLSLP